LLFYNIKIIKFKIDSKYQKNKYYNNKLNGFIHNILNNL